MSDSAIRIRLMDARDFDAVVEIDRKVFNVSRPEYYEMKFEKLLEAQDSLPVSLVAEAEDGSVVGFVMGELYLGEYGIFHDQAKLDTIGVDPNFQQRGVGRRLLDEFIAHLKKLGVQKIYTLVGWDDSQLVRFFSDNDFSPSRTIHLERDL